MRGKKAVRPLRLPPSDFDSLKIPAARVPPRTWFRVHQSRFAAAYFCLSPAHRFSHEDCPYPILYLAADVATCLFERFGDKAYDGQHAIALSLWQAHSIAAFKLPSLLICDLTSARTLSRLTLDLTALMERRLSTPQRWGLALQRHPAKFQAIRFKSRFNGKPCLALFQRGTVEAALKEKPLGPLPTNDAAVDWLAEHKVSLY